MFLLLLGSRVSCDLITDCLKANTVLVALNVSNLDIGDSGTAALATLVRCNSSIKELNLSNNSITTHGVRDVADALKQNQGLTSLILSQVGTVQKRWVCACLDFGVGCNLESGYMCFGAARTLGLWFWDENMRMYLRLAAVRVCRFGSKLEYASSGNHQTTARKLYRDSFRRHSCCQGHNGSLSYLGISLCIFCARRAQGMHHTPQHALRPDTPAPRRQVCPVIGFASSLTRGVCEV